MPSSAASERDFFGRVESLRGLGAVAVALVHFGGASVHDVALLPTIAPLVPGHAALMMFFIISGFVLRLSLGHGPQRFWSAGGRFLVKRIFRVYPIVVVGIGLTAWYYGGIITTEEQCRLLTTREFIANVLLLETSMNNTLWALQLEVLLAPLMVLLYFVERWWSARIVLALALVMGLLSFSPYWAINPGLSQCGYAVVLGMTVPTYGRRFVEGQSKLALRLGLAVVLLVFVAVAPSLGMFTPWTRLAETMAAWWFISAVVYRSDMNCLCWLDNRWLRRGGQISGSFYVLHVLLGTLLFAQWHAGLLPPSWLCTPVVLGSFLLFIGSCSWFSYQLVEKPGITLGNWLLGHWAKSSEPIPTLPQPTYKNNRRGSYKISCHPEFGR